jgi:TonB family protein
MFMFLAAALLTPPEPINPVAWFSDANWQQLLAGKTDHGLVRIRVTVSPAGEGQDCFVEATSGLPKLDSLTCELVMKRARFKPAKWNDDKPAFAIYRRNVLWADGDSFDYSRPIDVEVSVDRLPRHVHSPVAVGVRFAVSADGTRSSCEAADKDANPALASIACQQVLASYPAIPARDANRNPVSSIQNAVVSFVTDQPK